jgi:hypothetical protein
LWDGVVESRHGCVARGRWGMARGRSRLEASSRKLIIEGLSKGGRIVEYFRRVDGAKVPSQACGIRTAQEVVSAMLTMQEQKRLRSLRQRRRGKHGRRVTVRLGPWLRPCA